MAERILIADDEADMRTLLTIALKSQGYEVLAAENGARVIDLLRREAVDVLILDLMMPEVDGWQVLQEVRGKTPTLILSARGAVEDRVKGLNLGASDYLLKPFDMRELIARVQALLRRQESKELLRRGSLVLDRTSKEVRVEEQLLELTPKEYELLEFLALHPGQVFSREQLVDRLWGYDYTGELRAVDTHIKKVRLKLREAGGDGNWVATVWGFGYKFEGAAT
ncbi:two-component system response regulator ResD [Tumebacillus sp. BK434]|uniref:response regulator transcription factor n=1 Tax=Tumebacillus sp. BK434 TaxID=2512169 RepID=UPI0010D684A8|nr:response regulator transcription factor [Tumebacillus sp. BK434]TCP55520.1 two-component system response regulator ResD [Tumebacillus sp. BK434]